MTLAATTLRATGVLGLVCALLAVATLWLVFTEPVTVARVLQDGDVAALFQVMVTAVGDMIRTAARYL